MKNLAADSESSTAAAWTRPTLRYQTKHLYVCIVYRNDNTQGQRPSTADPKRQHVRRSCCKRSCSAASRVDSMRSGNMTRGAPVRAAEQASMSYAHDMRAIWCVLKHSPSSPNDSRLVLELALAQNTAALDSELNWVKDPQG